MLAAKTSTDKLIKTHQQDVRVFNNLKLPPKSQYILQTHFKNSFHHFQQGKKVIYLQNNLNILKALVFKSLVLIKTLK